MIICRWLEVSVWGFRWDSSQEDFQEKSRQGVDFGISDSIALHSGPESLAHGLQSSPSAGSVALLDIVGGLFIIIIPALSQAGKKDDTLPFGVSSSRVACRQLVASNEEQITFSEF